MSWFYYTTILYYAFVSIVLFDQKSILEVGRRYIIYTTTIFKGFDTGNVDNYDKEN